MSETISSTNEKDVDLLRSVFFENEALLKVIRSLFFGLDLTDEQKKSIQTAFVNPELRNAFRKKIYPMLSDDTTIAISGDFWLPAEKDVYGGMPSQIEQTVFSKQQVLEMLQYAVSLLENPFQTKVDLSYNPKLILNDPLQIRLLAITLYIRTLNQAFGQVYLVANTKVETAEETKEKTIKNSTK